MTSTPNGIAGLTGRVEVPCALSVGIKGSNGAPTEKDRFHVLLGAAVDATYKTRDGRDYKSPTRAPHPAFAAFNDAGPESRRLVQAKLAHERIGQCFAYRRQCNSGAEGIPAHPKKAPVCKGDGVTAQRWDGETYRPIVCTGDQCRYSQAGTDRNGRPSKPPCGPWMQFVARFDESKLPKMPFKFTSGSWHSVKAFVGFFDEIARVCRELGIEPDRLPLFGLPVTLQLTEKTNPRAQSRFPVVSITVNGTDLVTWIEWQLKRAEDVRKLAAERPVLSAADVSEETEALDMAMVRPGMVR